MLDIYWTPTTPVGGHPYRVRARARTAPVGMGTVVGTGVTVAQIFWFVEGCSPREEAVVSRYRVASAERTSSVPKAGDNLNWQLLCRRPPSRLEPDALLLLALFWEYLADASRFQNWSHVGGSHRLVSMSVLQESLESTLIRLSLLCPNCYLASIEESHASRDTIEYGPRYSQGSLARLEAQAHIVERYYLKRHTDWSTQFVTTVQVTAYCIPDAKIVRVHELPSLS